MIDQGQAAFEMHVRPSEDDAAVRRGADHRPGGSGQVDAIVGTGRRAVQDPLGAPLAGDAIGLQRPDEAVAEILCVGPTGEGFGLQGDLALDAGKQIGIARFDGRGRQAIDAGRGELVGGDIETPPGRTAAQPSLDLDAGGGVPVEADDEQTVRRSGRQGLALDEDQGAGRGSAEGVSALTPGAVERQIDRSAACASGLGGGLGGPEPGRRRQGRPDAEQQSAAGGDHPSFIRAMNSIGLK